MLLNFAWTFSTTTLWLQFARILCTCVERKVRDTLENYICILLKGARNFISVFYVAVAQVSSWRVTILDLISKIIIRTVPHQNRDTQIRPSEVPDQRGAERASTSGISIEINQPAS